MKANALSSLTVLAAVAAAFSLAACDQNRPGSTASKSSEPMASSAPSTSPSTGSTASTGDTSSTMAAQKSIDKASAGADDAALTAQVRTALMAEPALKSQPIEVDTKDATVTLSGSVDSAASKARAKEIAASVGGVSGVVDQLTVKSS